MDRVAGLVLAAGGGRRVGGPKALFRLAGELLVERATEALRAAGCAPVVVVLGAGAEHVRAAAGLGDAEVVVNPGWGTGLGSSLRAGLAALADSPAVATVVLPVDAPGVTSEAVRRVAALPYAGALVCATYGRRRGQPLLLGRDHWAGVAELAKGDVGAQPYLEAHAAVVVEVACDGVGTDDDVDTPEAVAALGIVAPEGTLPPTPAGRTSLSDSAAVAVVGAQPETAQPSGR